MIIRKNPVSYQTVGSFVTCSKSVCHHGFGAYMLWISNCIMTLAWMILSNVYEAHIGHSVAKMHLLYHWFNFPGRTSGGCITCCKPICYQNVDTFYGYNQSLHDEFTIKYVNKYMDISPYGDYFSFFLGMYLLIKLSHLDTHMHFKIVFLNKSI